ncbi:MAG: type III-B CRISPR module RAMP protein Cmr1 [Verrucomicrobiia bacterium]
MKTKTFTIHFLTPCFCGGANPSKAEIRPSEIRGQLRWWFRALGGLRDEEETIFGGAAGNTGKASSIIVRCERTGTTANNKNKDWYNKIPKDGVKPITYLLGFFCGRTNRLTENGGIAPEETAKIFITFRRELSELLNKKLDLALRAFFSIGAFGFRTTRTAGAFYSDEYRLNLQKWEDLKKDLESRGFNIYLFEKEFSTWIELCRFAGEKLKAIRKEPELKPEDGKRSSPIGSADPRQTSALHFRPVLIDSKLRLALIEAPHNRVVGNRAKKLPRDKKSILNYLEQKEPSIFENHL